MECSKDQKYSMMKNKQTNKQTKERTEWSAVKNIERREKKRKKSGEERQNKKKKKGMTGAREKESDLTR